MASDSPLRRHRLALGLTQAELAAAAGVSRQLVVAVETGVNVPAVDAALRLATALQASTEELFGDAMGHGHAIVVAGCDPAMAIAHEMLGADRMVVLDAPTDTALAALRAGGVHAAVVHGPLGLLPASPPAVTRLHLARWQVGLAAPVALALHSLEACLERSVPIVQRQETAASQQGLRRACAALGRELPAGAVASGHAEVARMAVAARCAGITTEGAARENHLSFIPLEEHTVEVWISGRAGGERTTQAFSELLAGRDFQRRASRLGGYDLSACGVAL